LTDANRFYNLSHAICYSYGTDKHWKNDDDDNKHNNDNADDNDDCD